MDIPRARASSRILFIFRAESSGLSAVRQRLPLCDEDALVRAADLRKHRIGPGAGLIAVGALNDGGESCDNGLTLRVAQLLDGLRPASDEEDLRGFEWRYLWQQCQSDAEAVVVRLPSAIYSVEVSADGQWLLASSRGGGVKVWHLASGEDDEGLRLFCRTNDFLDALMLNLIDGYNDNFDGRNQEKCS